MYIGLDIGTSSVKALLIDAAQRPVHAETAPLTLSRPRPSWSEQDPADWLAATDAVMAGLARAAPEAMRAVEGIGIAGQMHGATLLGQDDRPLRPCILWNDGRAADACTALDDREPAFRTLGGNLVMPGFTAPKLEWVRTQEPAVFDQIATVLLPKDYVRLHLTGEKISDMSDAAGTLWLDVARRDWSDRLLSATGLDRGQMPRLVEGIAAGGVLRHELAARWGMGGRVVVAGGGGDNAASACGVGVVAPGAAFLSIGTSGVLFVCTQAFSPNTEGAVHAFCHAVPSLWHQMGVVLSAAASLEWLAGVTGTPASRLAEEAGALPRSPGRAMFAPYLAGERTPHNDATVRAGFVSLDGADDRAVLARAVMEGVAFSMRDCLDALAAAGTRIESVLAVGGGARSPTWLDMMADTLDVPVRLPAEGEIGAAFGAARLGMIAASGATVEEVCVEPAIRRVHAPKAAPAYAEALARWRKLYPFMKEAKT
ncbi:MAG: xylulokinase [Pseudomonadota bacterium]